MEGRPLHDRSERHRDKRRLAVWLLGGHTESVARATRTLRNIEGCWVKDMNGPIENNQIVGYKVNPAVTFMLEDTT
jgi:flavin-binding protein dodecin